MKRNDIIIIAMIAVGSAILTYVVSTTLLSEQTQQTTEVPTVQKITSTVVEPDPEIFNTNAINPSVQINIDETQVK